MGKRERQRQLNKLIRDHIAGGAELLELKDTVQKFRSREEHPDIGYIYNELCRIADVMREQADQWRKEAN